MPRRKDFLDEIVEDRSKVNPRFPELVDAALERRKLLRELAGKREAAGISQTVVAAKMGTSQSAVARIESGEADVRLSTVERYASAVGSRVTWSVTGHEPARQRHSAARKAARPPSKKRMKARAKT